MFMKQQESSQIRNTEMFKALADRIIASKPQQPVTQNNISLENSQVNTNITNKKFNLNVFLNEKCKNAMNLSDFIENISVSMEDLEHFGEVGYTEGMTNILTKAIQSKDVTERPLHCTDVKRETMYVRKDDVWQKDQGCQETKRFIENVASKNYKMMKLWTEEHPNHNVHDTEDHEAWYSIARNICNTEESALKKLVKQVAIMTAVDKDALVVVC